MCPSVQIEHNGHAQRKKHVVEFLRMLNVRPLERQSCIVLLCMLNVTPQTWIEEGEELGKEVHVSLNVTEIESKQDRGEPRKEASSAHVGLNVTESKQDREDSCRDLEPEYQKD